VGKRRTESEVKEAEDKDKEGNEEEEKDKLKPNFELSGKLSEEARTTSTGAVLKFMEPADAQVPTIKWRLYPFKGDEALDPISLTHKSCYIFGRDKAVADIPVEHPSCSKQHAVIQFRGVELLKDEEKITIVKPYLMDLKSTNGTILNGTKIEDSRYYELKEKDVVKFGGSTRDYVLLHEDLVAVERDSSPFE